MSSDWFTRYAQSHLYFISKVPGGELPGCSLVTKLGSEHSSCCSLQCQPAATGFLDLAEMRRGGAIPNLVQGVGRVVVKNWYLYS